MCTAFNANFDGDQIAVHVTLSHDAIAEASFLMLFSHNIFNPANETPLAVPTKDSTQGARKGFSDTALKTADAGFLTRRLIDVAQNVITTEKDCNTLRGLTISILVNKDEIAGPVFNRILGRVSLRDKYDSKNKKLLVAAGTEITEEAAQ